MIHKLPLVHQLCATEHENCMPGANGSSLWSSQPMSHLNKGLYLTDRGKPSVITISAGPQPTESAGKEQRQPSSPLPVPNNNLSCAAPADLPSRHRLNTRLTDAEMKEHCAQTECLNILLVLSMTSTQLVLSSSSTTT